ncbi:hypothetical protein [Streptomyces sp. NPDC058623]|uniref:hypothetical protein n=1 Tax=Streptomyces sp. NPDC058623 TaxID=3346563 RepID=UPI00365AC8B2
MDEPWVFTDSAVPAWAATALDVLQERIAAGNLETWLTSSHDRSPAIISGTDHARFMLLDDEADPGEHAISPGANSSSSGFVLANGQDDEYPDEDTVPFPEAMRIVSYILTTGAPPTGVPWTIDR